MITRLPGAVPTRCRAVIHNGIVSTVATSADKSAGIFEQTRNALAAIEANLTEAGTAKSRLLTATVYITDMANKAEMDRAWGEWIDPKNPPMRACVGAALEGTTLVEIVVTAAV